MLLLELIWLTNTFLQQNFFYTLKNQYVFTKNCFCSHHRDLFSKNIESKHKKLANNNLKEITEREKSIKTNKNKK